MGSVKDNLNKNDRIPSIWSRKTVADGSWLQYHTLNPLSARDEYLAECIDDLSGSTDEKIIEERERAISAENELQDQIDTMEAATDVVDVQGTYADFMANSASYFPNNITFNDIVKVLNDEETEPSGHQTYWRLVPTGGSPKKPTPTNSKWDYVGYTDPYYSRQEVDNIVDGLSGTISSTYLSANDTAVSAGKNIVIDYDTTNPYIKINTDDDVVFNNVSAEVSISAKSATIIDSTLSNVSSSNISASNLTALTANGTDAIFTNFSGTNISGTNNTTTIDELITSAENGKEAYDSLSDSKIYKTISVNGTNIDATTSADTFTITASTNDNISITADASNKTITLSAKDTTYSNGNNITISGNTNTINLNDDVLLSSLSATEGLYIKHYYEGGTADGWIKLTHDVFSSYLKPYASTPATAASSTPLNIIKAGNLEGSDCISISSSKSAYSVNLSSTITATSAKIDTISATTLQGIDYVKHTEYNLKLNSLYPTNSTATSYSTAFGNNINAGGGSFAVASNDMDITTSTKNDVTGKSFSYGQGNSSYYNSYTLGERDYASGNCFVVGNDNSAKQNSVAMGVNAVASSFGFAFGNDVSARNFSVAMGVGIKTSTAINGSIVAGMYPSTESLETKNCIFVIGHGANESNRHNVIDANLQHLRINENLRLNSTFSYIHSEDTQTTQYININESWDSTSSNYNDINAKNIILFGAITDNYQLIIPPPSSKISKEFRIFRAGDWDWNIRIGVASGYNIILKNFPTFPGAIDPQYWLSGVSSVNGTPSDPWPATAFPGTPILANGAYIPSTDYDSKARFFSFNNILGCSSLYISVDTKKAICTIIKGGF